MIDQLHPDYIVYGNEVNSLDKYSGTVAQFQRLMALGHAVASSRGVLFGGTALMGSVTAHATYADLLATEGKSRAAAFKKAAGMAAFSQGAADKANAYIDACKAAGLDYFVWHSYLADPSAILDIKRYVEKRFGGPSFVNELGWRTGSASTGKGDHRRARRLGDRDRPALRVGSGAQRTGQALGRERHTDGGRQDDLQPPAGDVGMRPPDRRTTPQRASLAEESAARPRRSHPDR